MANNDTFKLKGSYSVTPAPSAINNSGNFEIGADILEQLSVLNKVAVTITLDADPAEAVNFSDLASAAAIILKTSGKVIARLTSADGAAQAIPVDGFLFVLSASVPFTALTLQRVAGVTTTAKVVLVEKA